MQYYAIQYENYINLHDDARSTKDDKSSLKNNRTQRESIFS